MNEIHPDKNTIYGVRYTVQGGPTRRCHIYMTEKSRDKEVDRIRTVCAGITYAETFEFKIDTNSYKKVKG